MQMEIFHANVVPIPYSLVKLKYDSVKNCASF